MGVTKINSNLFPDDWAVCWYHDFGINRYRMVIMTHQTLTLEKYWKLFEEHTYTPQRAKLQDQKVSLLWSLQIFFSTLEAAEKKKSIKFHWKYELWQPRFPGKIVHLLHNNMQARYPLLIQFSPKQNH